MVLSRRVASPTNRSTTRAGDGATMRSRIVGPDAVRMLFVAAVMLMTTPTHAASGRADSVLAELKAGNERHVKAAYRHPHESTARRSELVRGQQPGAVILSCSDSRVAPEIVFDQGLGDL